VKVPWSLRLFIGILPGLIPRLRGSRGRKGDAVAVRRPQAEWTLLTLYEKFEQIVILILTGLIAIVIVFAIWNLALRIFHAVIAPQMFDPTEYSVFQAVLGAIFTVIIALEFKRWRDT
jgi:Phosphate-starvation-inducible E family